jgi:8-oxo-dGTP pyrophosphatase MutT (NUDIX family)
MVREFKEETGVQTCIIQWREFAYLHGDYFQVLCFVCVDDVTFDAVKNWENNRSKSETEPLVAVSVSELPIKEMISNLPWLLYLCLDKDQPRILLEAKYSGSGN